MTLPESIDGPNSKKNLVSNYDIIIKGPARLMNGPVILLNEELANYNMADSKIAKGMGKKLLDLLDMDGNGIIEDGTSAAIIFLKRHNPKQLDDLQKDGLTWGRLYDALIENKANIKRIEANYQILDSNIFDHDRGKPTATPKTLLYTYDDKVDGLGKGEFVVNLIRREVADLNPMIGHHQSDEHSMLSVTPKSSKAIHRSSLEADKHPAITHAVTKPHQMPKTPVNNTRVSGHVKAKNTYIVDEMVSFEGKEETHQSSKMMMPPSDSPISTSQHESIVSPDLIRKIQQQAKISEPSLPEGFDPHSINGIRWHTNPGYFHSEQATALVNGKERTVWNNGQPTEWTLPYLRASDQLPQTVSPLIKAAPQSMVTKHELPVKPMR